MTRRSWETDAGFSRRAVIWIAVVTAVSFVVGLVIMARGPKLGDASGTGPGTFSDSALGHKAVARFLEGSDVDVTIRRTRQMFRGRPDRPLLVVEPDADADGLRSYLRSVLRSARDRGAPVVVVLPKWRGEPDPERDRWVGRATLMRATQVQRVVDELEDGLEVLRPTAGAALRTVTAETAWGETLALPLIVPQTLATGGAYEPVVSSDLGVLVARWGAGGGRATVYVVSDPDLLNNHGLARGDNAVLVSRLVEDVLSARAVIFDEIVHGAGLDRSFLAEMLHFPMVLLVLHGGLVFGLVFWSGLSRFGKPEAARPRLPPGKLGLLDNTSKLLSYRGRIRDSAVRYFDETLLGVARHYHLARELDRESLVTRLQAIGRERGITTDLDGIHVAVASLDESRRDVGSRCVDLALKLHRWREEMTDGH